MSFLRSWWALFEPATGVRRWALICVWLWGCTFLIYPFGAPVFGALAVLVLPLTFAWWGRSGVSLLSFRLNEWIRAVLVFPSLTLIGALNTHLHGRTLNFVDTWDWLAFGFSGLLFGLWVKQSRALVSGLTLGVLLVTPVLLWQFWVQQADFVQLEGSFAARRSSGFSNPLIVANLLVGAMVIIAILQPRGWLRTAALCAGFVGAILTQSRGAWLALPLVGVALAWRGADIRRHAKAILFSLVALLVISGVFAADRVALSVRELALISEGHPELTPSGLRLVLWRAVLLIIEHDPWLGTGINQFQSALLSLVQKGAIPGVVELDHAHSTFMNVLVELGLPGLLILCLSYVTAIVTGWWYRAVPEGRAMMLFVLAWAIFGLTQDLNAHAETQRAFGIMLGTLFGVLHARDRQGPLQYPNFGRGGGAS